MPNIQMKLAQAVSLPVLVVTDFGAKGDGAADDTAAINAAIAAAEDGQMIFFPKGTYNISSGLVIDKPIVLQGVLSPIAFKGSIIYKTGDFVGITMAAADVVIRNIGLDGVGSSVDSSYGIYSRYRCTLDNVAVHNQGSDGICLEQFNDTDNLNKSYLKVYAVNNGNDGIGIHNNSNADDNVNDIIIIAPQVDGNMNDGIHVDEGRGDFIVADCTNNGEYGLYIFTEGNFAKVHTKGNGDTGVYIEMGEDNNIIIGDFEDDTDYDEGSNLVYDVLAPRLLFPEKLLNGAMIVASGDGSTTVFTLQHGLIGIPNSFSVTPASHDAAGAFYVTADATYLTVTYLTAPPAGSSNLKWYYTAEMS